MWNWRRGHPAFAAAYANAMLGARTAALAAQADQDALRRFEVAEGLRAPSGRVAWNRGLSGYSPELARRICARLGVGQSLQAVCREPGTPCVATVYNWMRACPEFAVAYVAAKEAGFYWVVCDAADTAQWLGDERKSHRRLEKIVDAAHRRCAQLAPKRYASGPYGAAPRRKLDWLG